MKIIKKNKVRIGFLVLLIVTVYLVSNIFRIKSPHGINQLEGLYWQPDQAIDVVMNPAIFTVALTLRYFGKSMG